MILGAGILTAYYRVESIKWESTANASVSSRTGLYDGHKANDVDTGHIGKFEKKKRNGKFRSRLE